MRLLEQQVRDKQAAPRSNYSPPSIKANGGNLGSGSANFASGVYTGTFRRVTNPYIGNAYWSLYEGIYKAVTGVQYTGSFHYFQQNNGEHSQFKAGEAKRDE